MSRPIDAETAKLAGLQIDQLNKIRKGSLSLSEIEGFLNMKPKVRSALFGSGKFSASLVAEVELPQAAEVAAPAPIEKFTVLKDLGEIVVPDDYDHATALAKFKKEHGKKFYYFNDAVTDENFKNSSRVLKPGDRFHVRAHHQVVGGETTSNERMEYLAKLGTVHTGAQGAALVFIHKHDLLPRGKWYASFDHPENLPLLGGGHRVPFVNAHSHGGFGFYLGGFERVWNDDHAFLSFSDVDESLET